MLAALTARQWMWAAGACYLAGFAAGAWALRRRGRPSGLIVYLLVAVGYLLQVFGLAERGRAVGGCPLGNAFELCQFTAWSAITLYLVVGVTFRSSVLGYFTAGLGAVLTLVSLAMPSWDAVRRAHAFGGNPWIEFHAALALFSYGVFALLALTSLLLLFRLHSLRARHLGGWFSLLPSVLDLDHISVRLLGAAVGLLAASLVVGAAYWLRDTSSVAAPKLLLTATVWLAAAIALGLRLRGRLVARTFAWTCVALFAVAMASLGAVNASRRPVPPPAAELRP
ncbi:MAG TPA: cytochrome c biogenesis protein CcsA [Opitutaceae bacterium]|jgi:ABC-type uncharacterized transport system permease subunit|nr:cytochrome c biogenesis protein CcsA [Opitutaceae bacterium]